jgi:hypothetical protein
VDAARRRGCLSRRSVHAGRIAIHDPFTITDRIHLSSGTVFSPGHKPSRKTWTTRRTRTPGFGSN